MKKILTVYTGGTICCEADGKMRDLNPELAKRALISNFAGGTSEYASLSSELFKDSELESQTLSENMTLEKLSAIIKHIKKFDSNNYSGIIVMHGTDTLAFTASIFSCVFSHINVPIMIVSGNRPPCDEKSNANENFRAAVELIMGGIASNVYVPYLNSDGKMMLHLGTNIMQCANFSEDFYGADKEKSIILNSSVYEKCKTWEKEAKVEFKEFNSSVMFLTPYTGLDYSKITLEGIKAVVHGSYHSGTVCVERNTENEHYSAHSLLWFAKECEKRGVSLFVAPTTLDSDQYSSVFDLAKNSSAVLLNMTQESAYAKVLVGVSCNFSGDELIKFVKNKTSC